MKKLADDWLPMSHILHPWAQRTLRHQTPEVGAGCLNWARPVLCGALRNERPYRARDTLLLYAHRPRGTQLPAPGSSVTPFKIVSRFQPGYRVTSAALSRCGLEVMADLMPSR